MRPRLKAYLFFKINKNTIVVEMWYIVLGQISNDNLSMDTPPSKESV